MLSLGVIVLLDGKPTESEDKEWERLKKKYNKDNNTEDNKDNNTEDNKAISVIVLSDDEFEGLHPPHLVATFLADKGHPPWDSGKLKDYANALPHIASLQNRSEKAREIGKLKCELATFVAEQIDLKTLEENYSKLFPFIVV